MARTWNLLDQSSYPLLLECQKQGVLQQGGLGDRVARQRGKNQKLCDPFASPHNCPPWNRNQDSLGGCILRWPVVGSELFHVQKSLGMHASLIFSS